MATAAADTGTFGRKVFVGQPEARRSILKEYLRGAARRLRKGDPADPLDQGLVRRFFETRSAADDFRSFTDSGRPWYLTCLDASRPLRDALAVRQPVRVLDIGCGRATLLGWLRHAMAGRPMDYVGTDFDSVAVERCRQAYGGPGLRFEVEDISQPSLEATGFDVVFCINVLPYVPDPRPILETCARRCAAGTGLLALMEPVPSAYWGSAFGGFRIRLRQPDEIAAAAESIGGRPVDAAVLYTWQVLGRPVLPVGAMSAWRFPNR